jgi:epoxyqueuosine reductase
MFSKEEMKAEAARLGFLLCGVTSPEPPAHLDAYHSWLDAGRHAGMDYLASPRSLAARADPHLILPGCQSILVLAAPYPAPVPVNAEDSGQIAAYARSSDYHNLLPPRLEALAGWIADRCTRSLQWRACTDTAPILEKELAQRAGLGWIGRNTCLIHPQIGSYFFLAELLLDIPIEPDLPFTADRCGDCQRCMDACPTACILPNRTLDANRCLSYLTIENKGSIPAELRPALGNNVFGCDICQTVCPWNQKPAARPPQTLFPPLPDLAAQHLSDELLLDDDTFRARFDDTPILRAKRRGYLRNVIIALGNARCLETIPALAASLHSDLDPLVRVHAAWALGQMPDPQALTALHAALAMETSRLVLDEIEMAIRNYPVA